MTPRLPLAIALLLTACGGEGGGGTSPPSVAIAIAVTGGNGQSDTVSTTLPVPLQVLVTADGVPAEGRIVRFLPATGSGTVTPTVDTTGADGIATTTWTLPGGAGTRSVAASVVGTSVPAVQFSATVRPGLPTSLVGVAGDDQIQAVDQAFPRILQVQLRDRFGNGIQGATVSWSATGNASVAAPTSVTNAAGAATIGVTAGSAPGAATVAATVVALPGQVGFDLTIVPTLNTVNVSSNFFSPNSLTIPSGGAVKWTWTGGSHDVASTAGPVNFGSSPVQGSGATFGPVIFTTVGVYTYLCNLHDGMTGTITVQ